MSHRKRRRTCNSCWRHVTSNGLQTIPRISRKILFSGCAAWTCGTGARELAWKKRTILAREFEMVCTFLVQLIGLRVAYPPRADAPLASAHPPFYGNSHKIDQL